MITMYIICLHFLLPQDCVVFKNDGAPEENIGKSIRSLLNWRQRFRSASEELQEEDYIVLD